MTSQVVKQGKRIKVSDTSKSADTIVSKHRGKDPKTMAQKDKDELFLAILKKLNMLDENDRIK